jgi:tRNA dimethylallyltransferase
MVKEEFELTKIPVIIIVGPTASGKSKLAIQIASKINACIVNADSRQIYKYCIIGTSSPQAPEIEQVPHYLYNFLEPSQQFSAAEYSSLASKVIKNIYSLNKIPMLVGGAGLYIKALLEGLFPAPGQNKNFRNALKNISNIMGTHFLFKQLQTIDPESSQTILPNDQFRIIRALEIYYLTGKTKSELIKQQNRNSTLSPLKIGIMPPKSTLYHNIEKRTYNMLQNGLIEEVKFLINSFPLSSPAFSSIGYKEVIHFLQGKTTLDEAVNSIIKNTKLYAKRQITWFKKDKNIFWLNPDEINIDELISKIYSFLYSIN